MQLHWSTARYAPWQEVSLLDGLADLVLSGAVRELGVSNTGPSDPNGCKTGWSSEVCV